MMSGKLHIAITADTYPYASEVTNLVEAPFAPRGLVEVLARLGAVPVILPDVAGVRGEAYVEMFDGLILPGGADVDPTLFGEEPVWKIGRTNYKRDLFELALFRAFYQSGKPIFGICRGCQLINIALGGNVYQDLPSENPQCTIRHSQGAPGGYPTHHVDLQPGSSLYGTLGPGLLSIPVTIRPSTGWPKGWKSQRKLLTEWRKVWKAMITGRWWLSSGIRKICGRSIRRWSSCLLIS